ncbi:MAG: hypothetical protein HY822_03400 [Acidobacteria bacterium]|nr:hypothetical protein [Acidobacteriota bacterium]
MKHLVLLATLAACWGQDLPPRLPALPYHLTARPWKPLEIPRDAYLDAVEGVCRAADLLAAGLRAMDHATRCFAGGSDRIPDRHGEFFIPSLAGALELYDGRAFYRRKLARHPARARAGG